MLKLRDTVGIGAPATKQETQIAANTIQKARGLRFEGFGTSASSTTPAVLVKLSTDIARGGVFDGTSCMEAVCDFADEKDMSTGRP